jgi:hypothetical protein
MESICERRRIMANPSVAETIRECVERLPSADKIRVLEYARSLERPKGVPGRDLLDLAGTIDPEDLEIMKQAIEEGCERIEPDAW